MFQIHFKPYAARYILSLIWLDLPQDKLQHHHFSFYIHFKPKPQDIYALWYGSNLLQNKLQHHHFSFQSHFKAQAARYIQSSIWLKSFSRYITKSSPYVSNSFQALCRKIYTLFDIVQIFFKINYNIITFRFKVILKPKPQDLYNLRFG